MLTPAQQKVKQELEELQAAGRFYHAEKTGSLTPHPSSMKKWVILAAGFLLILLMAVLYSFHPNQSDLAAYLTKEQLLYRQSEQLLNQALSGHTVDYREAKAEQIHLWKRLSALDPPSRLQAHKLDLLHVMEQQQEILTYLDVSKVSNTATLNHKIIELRVKQELVMESLQSALEREKIKYERLEDGTVHYWVDSRVYTY
ncbi:hypothetical protein J7E81_18805 [Bacillus sp. ISL-18]|uniref:hypothetical protein n=1 Tax=Bacillus sp. ISL-18 TaxID=2819118 RepID=UPI001BE76524|nr:hypothetical protein [Bacillus sp. ISL-18]MBT2657251.1 hypothetical protein [Bacillus sp. ISL-18]